MTEVTRTERRIGWHPKRCRFAAVFGLALAGFACAGSEDAGTENTPPAANASQTPGLSQLTDSPDLEVFPSFSADGSRLAYSADRSGRLEIYVRTLDGKGAEQQITTDGRSNLQAAFSPDGATLAYHSIDAGGIWVVPVEGGEPLQLSPFGSDPAWSPDGKTIVFQSAPLSALSLFTFPAMPPSALWLVPATGGEPSQLTRTGEPTGGHGAPVWSPDGGRIAFTSYKAGSGQLWTVAAAGDDPQLLEDALWPRDPVYSIDGKSLYYSGPNPERGFGIWRIPTTPDGQAEYLIARPLRHLAISPDGQRLAVSELGQRSNIRSTPVDLVTGLPTGPAVSLTEDPVERNSQAAFSPDGRRIALHRVSLGNRFEIWLLNAEGGERSILTAEGTFGAGPPDWSPDGRHIVFLSRPDGRRSAPVFKQIEVGSGQTEVLRELERGWSRVQLSTDHQQLAFHRRGGPAEQSTVWVAPMLDGDPVQVTTAEDAATFPAWSADGQWLAVQLQRGAASHIGVVPASGGAVTQLTFGAGESWQANWSPDGEHIAFAGLRDKVWNIWTVPSAGGEPQKVTDLPNKIQLYVRYPNWSPLGEQIIYEYAETLADLWILDL